MGGIPERPDTFFSISPADVAGVKSFAVRRGFVEGRLDTQFNHPHYEQLNSRFEKASVPTPELRKLLVSISSGATPRRSDSSLYADSGVKFLRILNVEDGEILEGDLKYITPEVHHGQLQRSQLEEDDVLMTITGRVGSAAVVGEDQLPANINQHLVRMRIDQTRCRPAFLSEWLNSPAGLELSNRYVSGGTRSALDYEAIRNVRVPVPNSLQVQDRLLAVMNEARSERKAKLAEADALLAGVDEFVLDALGVLPPPEDSRRVFATRGQVDSGRFDPHYHLPRFARIEDALSRTQCERLGDIVEFSKETWKPQDHTQSVFRYIEISTVSPQTGEASWDEVPTEEAPSRARMKVRTDDIIVSLTRPHHGSIAHLGPDFDGCIASTGFAVIRSVATRLHREYLWSVLRSRVCLSQMLQRASGGNYPAILESELAKLLVPVPNKEVQIRIAAEVQRRQDESRHLRAEAEASWQDAKHWFESQLLAAAE